MGHLAKQVRVGSTTKAYGRAAFPQEIEGTRNRALNRDLSISGRIRRGSDTRTSTYLPTGRPAKDCRPQWVLASSACFLPSSTQPATGAILRKASCRPPAAASPGSGSESLRVGLNLFMPRDRIATLALRGRWVGLDFAAASQRNDSGDDTNRSG
jgi:hypothetical protein